MDLVVEITHAGLLPDLIGGLERSGCRADPLAPSACRVVPPRAAEEDEMRLALTFFLRAWQLQHPGVDAKISY